MFDSETLVFPKLPPSPLKKRAAAKTTTTNITNTIISINLVNLSTNIRNSSIKTILVDNKPQFIEIMKTIYLIRHAESDLNKDDFHRTLSNTGKENAKSMSQHLEVLGIKFDKIFCSNAMRTRVTAKYLCNDIHYNASQIQYKESLYLITPANLIQFISNSDDSNDVIAIISHNPGLTQTRNYLTNENSGDIPPCGVVKVDLTIDNWNEITAGIGSESLYVYPNMLH